MELIQHCKEAFFNLYLSKMRSLLAVLGVLIGTTAVVALVSGGQLATENALAQFKTLGTNLLSVTISSGDEDGDTARIQNNLTVADVKGIQEQVRNITVLAPYTLAFLPITYEGRPIDGGIIGTDESLKDILKLQMRSGRFVSYLDRDAFYCVVGGAIADKLHSFGVYQPIGQQIQLGNNLFTIVGIIQHMAPNAFVEADIDQTVVIPINAALLLDKYTQIRNIVFRLQDKTRIKDTEQEIAGVINAAVPKQKLFFRSAQELIKSMARQRETFTWLLGFIGGISLLVGGIGVMNIMLVSITERRREIGIRMALGARRRDIRVMFLIEAVALTIFGGILGIFCGIIASYMIALTAKWQFQLFFAPPLIGSAVSVLTGVFFGYYPAHKASRMDPIEMLRAE